MRGVRVTLLLIALLSLTFCNKRELVEESHLIVKLPPKSKSGNSCEEVKSSQLLLFDRDGQLEKRIFTTQLLDEITFRIRAGKKYLVVLFNLPEEELEEIEQLSQLKELSYAPLDGIENSLIYSAIEEIYVWDGTHQIDISPEGIGAKFSFTFDKSLLDEDVDLEITSIAIKNSPSHSPLLANEGFRCDHYLEIAGELMPPFNSNSHYSATPLYIAENLQGDIGDATEQWEKHPGERVSDCTYIEIKGSYSSPKAYGEVIYRTFPGNNLLNNYDIERGRHYRESIELVGSSIEECSWRRDISQLTFRSFLITAVASPPEGGTVDGSGQYLYGELPTLTAVANPSYKFKEWQPKIGPAEEDICYYAIFESSATGEPTTLTLTPSSITLNRGEDITLIPSTDNPLPPPVNLIWSSTNSDVATVTQQGVVTAVGVGETTIIATAPPLTLSAECSVKVLERIKVEPHYFLYFERNPKDPTIVEHASLRLYLKAQLELPSQLPILEEFYTSISLYVNYSFIENGMEYSGVTQYPLTLNPINNNAIPATSNYTLHVNTFPGPNHEDYFYAIANTINLFVTPGSHTKGTTTLFW